MLPNAVAEFVHESVLAGPVIEYLSVRDHATYVDATLGGGGHAAAILAATPLARLIGVDRDLDALAAARDRLAPFGDRVRLVHGRFGELPRLLRELGVAQVDGIVVDLGVSSPQLDRADRGFSFTRDGPIDMRMDRTTGPTALELVKSLDGDALAAVLSELGEERHARKVARAIKDWLRATASAAAPTTTQLADVVVRTIPIAEQRRSKIHAATRTFQALRMAVNRELDELDGLLAAFPDLLAPGGRCVAISFHSLEDRLVKNRFRDLAWTSSLPPRLAVEAGERVLPVVEVLTKKPITAADAELAHNPRARSAKLRACARTAAPNVPATGSAGSPRRP